MNQEKKKNWINQVLSSHKNIEDLEVNPFLFSKIMNKMERPDFLHQPVSASVSWSMLATLLLLILMNFGYFSFLKTEDSVSQTVTISEEVYEELAAEYLDQEDSDYVILTNYINQKDHE